MQLRLRRSENGASERLLGVLVRGMTYDGERWRLATVGDWQPVGSHLPQQDQVQRLRQICHELFELFGGDTSEEPAA